MTEDYILLANLVKNDNRAKKRGGGSSTGQPKAVFSIILTIILPRLQPKTFQDTVENKKYHVT